jgi:hypothetical protein
MKIAKGCSFGMDLLKVLPAVISLDVELAYM